MGRTIALALAGEGCDVAVHFHRSTDQARQTVEQIRAAGRRAELFHADLTAPTQIAAMFEDVEKCFGRLDILVNNAAVYHPTPIASLTAEQWDTELAVNARAPALCIRHAAERMAEGGVIINIVDIAAEKARASYLAYCASKAALLAVTKSAAKALAPNIRVNAVSPGAALWAEDSTSQECQKVLSQIPMRRLGCPADIAAAVVFLARADYITGQNLRVDGGWHTG